MNKARVRNLILVLAGFLIFIQFVQPERTNPPIVASKSMAAHVAIPDNVQTILLRACGDCHSNQTVWPWYSHVAPISWMVVDDVNEGRRHMNFQDWDQHLPSKKPTEALIDTCKEAREKGMPPVSYRLVHRGVALSPADLDTVCAWTQSLSSTSNSNNPSAFRP